MIRNPVAETLTSSIQSPPTPTDTRKANTDKVASASLQADAAQGRKNRAATDVVSAKRNLEQAGNREEAAQAEAKQATLKEASAQSKMKSATQEADQAQAAADQAARANDIKISGRAVNIFA